MTFRYALVWLITFFFLVALPAISCQQKQSNIHHKVKEIGHLSSKVKESSGLALAGDQGFWTHNDHGNKPNLYKIDKKGKRLETVKFDNITNIDWEDLTEDDAGYLYIGDFGNDNNDRKDLVIYKVLKTNLLPDVSNIPVEKISYKYPDQTKFPPKKKQRLFDVEALFYKDNFLYLLTKDQSHPPIDSSRLYRLPNRPGYHTAKHIGTFKTKSKKNKGQITGAALSPSGNKIAVTSNEEIWIFRNFRGDKFFDGTEEYMSLIKGLQVEAVVFTNECTLYLTCEQNDKSKASLFTIDLCSNQE